MEIHYRGQQETSIMTVWSEIRTCYYIHKHQGVESNVIFTRIWFTIALLHHCKSNVCSCSCTQPNHHLQHVVSEGRLFNWHSVPISRNGSRFTQFLRGFRTKGSLDKTGGRRGLVPVEEIPGTEKGFRDLFRPFCFTVFVS